MRRRLLFMIGIPLLVLLLAGVILLVLHPASPSPSVQRTPAPTATAVRLSVTDVTRLEQALSSPDMSVQATALVPDLATIYQQQGKPMLPAGATLKFLLNTEVCKDLSCRVNAVVTEKDGTTTTFVLYLDDGTGQWLIAATDEVR